MGSSYSSAAPAAVDALPTRLGAAQRLVDRLPAAPLLPALDRVLADLEGPQLRLEPQEAVEARGVEPAGRDRAADRAARLLAVAAVREAAGGGEALHVPERGLEARAVRPELDLAQTRRVEEQRPPRQRDQLPVARRVPAALVGRAH